LPNALGQLPQPAPNSALPPAPRQETSTVTVPAQTRAAVLPSPAQVEAQAQLFDEFLDPVVTRNMSWNKAVSVVFTTTAVATAGYALLVTRLATWLFTLVAARPLWQHFDPLEILFAWNEEKKRRGQDEEESLQSIVEKTDERTLGAEK
jgi:hypothetical protein